MCGHHSPTNHSRWINAEERLRIFLNCPSHYPAASGETWWTGTMTGCTCIRINLAKIEVMCFSTILELFFLTRVSQTHSDQPIFVSQEEMHSMTRGQSWKEHSSRIVRDNGLLEFRPNLHTVPVGSTSWLMIHEQWLWHRPAIQHLMTQTCWNASRLCRVCATRSSMGRKFPYPGWPGMLKRRGFTSHRLRPSYYLAQEIFAN